MKRKVITLHSPGALAEAARRYGWLRAAREALGLSRAEVARRLGISRASVQDFEAAEGRGSITLASFRRVAAALGGDAEISLRLPESPVPAQATRQAGGGEEAARGPAPVVLPVAEAANPLVWEYHEPGTQT